MNQSQFGLIGRNISYSFSQAYFTEKFKLLGRSDLSYKNYDIQDLNLEFKSVLTASNIKGLNVTIPYKKAVIPFLDGLDPIAAKIGAVNTIKIQDGKKIGYNTDAPGFRDSIKKVLPKGSPSALIFGTGGAAQAVAFALEDLKIPYAFVSRNSGDGVLSYASLMKEGFGTASILINCTPIGTFPKVEEKLELPYSGINENFLLFDLIYNPEITSFLAEGQKRGAVVKNGYEMLENQAELAWEIWNK